MFLLELLLTGFLYFIFPLIFTGISDTKKIPISLPVLFIFSSINALCIHFLFALWVFRSVPAPEAPSAAPMFLWGWITYRFMKKDLKNNIELHAIKISEKSKRNANPSNTKEPDPAIAPKIAEENILQESAVKPVADLLPVVKKVSVVKKYPGIKENIPMQTNPDETESQSPVVPSVKLSSKRNKRIHWLWGTACICCVLVSGITVYLVSANHYEEQIQAEKEKYRIDMRYEQGISNGYKLKFEKLSEDYASLQTEFNQFYETTVLLEKNEYVNYTYHRGGCYKISQTAPADLLSFPLEFVEDSDWSPCNVCFHKVK